MEVIRLRAMGFKNDIQIFEDAFGLNILLEKAGMQMLVMFDVF